MADIAAVTSIEITARDSTKPAFASLRGSFNDLQSSAATFQRMLGGLAGIAGAAFLGNMLRQVAEAAAALDDLADATGSSIEALSALGNTARVSGVGFEEYRTMMNRLSVGLAGVGEEGGKASKALEALGVTSKDPATAIVELALALDKYADGAEKAAVVTAIFGRNGAAMLPFLKDLAQDGLAAATVTAQLAAESEKLGKDWERTKISLEAFATSIASELVPAINGAIDDIKKGSQEAGGFWKALLQFGLSNPFADVTTRQRELREEIEKANKAFYQLANDGAGEGTLGVVEERIKSLKAELEQLNRQQLRSLQMLTGPGTFDARDYQARAKPTAPRVDTEPAKTAAVDKLAQAYAALERQLLDAVGALAKLSEAERVQIKIATGEYAKLTQAQRDRLVGIASTIDAMREQAAAERAAAKELEALIRAEEAMLEVGANLQEAATDALGAYAEQNAAIEAEIALIGKSNVEREKMIILLEAEAEKKKLIAAGDLEGLAILEQLIARRLELVDAKALAEGLEAQKKLVAEATAAQAEEWNRLWQSVDRAAEDAFTNILQGGKNAFDRLKDALKNGLYALLYQMTVRPFLINVMATMGGNAGIAGVLGGGASGGGMGGIGDLLSMGSNLFGGSGGSLLGTAGVSGLFSGAGGIFGAGAIGNSFALSGMGQALGLSAAGLEMAGGVALTGLGTALGTAIPILGAALAVATMLGAFEKDPDKTKGQFGFLSGITGFEDNQFTKTPFGNIGFMDANTQQFDGAGAQVFNQVVAGTLQAFADRMSEDQIALLSGRLQGTTFAEMEDEYTTEDWLKKFGAEILDKVISESFAVLDPKLQAVFDAFDGTADEMAEFANVLLTVHDLTENIPTGLRETLISALDGTEEVSEQVVAFAQAYLTLQEVLNRDPVEDALDGLARASASAYESLQMTADAFGDLIEAYDGSAEASQEIAEATAAYYNQLVQVIAGIRQLGQSIDAMFGGTIEDLTLQTLDDDGKKKYYQNQISLLYGQLGTATDPAEIDRITKQINEYMRAAFGLLTPDEQTSLLSQYTDFANQVNELAQQRLAVAEAQIQRQAEQLFDSLRTIMEKVAADMAAAAADQKSAAATMQQAANTINDAANTPQVVTLGDPTVNG